MPELILFDKWEYPKGDFSLKDVVQLCVCLCVCRLLGLEAHPIPAVSVCIKKSSSCQCWISFSSLDLALAWSLSIGSRTTYDGTDYCSANGLWQERGACNFIHSHESQSDSQLRSTGARHWWSLITSHQSRMQMSYYPVISYPFTPASHFPLAHRTYKL